MYEFSKAWAEEADRTDPLAPYRNRYLFPRQAGQEQIYLCGNSLGLQPAEAGHYVGEELSRWAQQAVQAHFQEPHPWYSYHQTVRDTLAQLCGAYPEEVTAMNSLTTNLHLMLASFFRPQGRRTKILMERDAFSSDYFAVSSQLEYHGLNPEEHLILIGPEEEGAYLPNEQILAAIDRHAEETALVLWSGVSYLSGQFYDLAALGQKCYEQKIPLGLDLAHAIGNVPLELHRWQVHFAVWCSYKYLNSGPGGVGGAFVHRWYHHKAHYVALKGWWGTDPQKRPPLFALPEAELYQFFPGPGSDAWQLSNAPVLPLAIHRAALEDFATAGMAKIREKSLKLTGYLEFLLRQTLMQPEKAYFWGKVSLLTPTNEAERGAQLSLSLERNGKELFRQLKNQGVVADWREPGTIRMAPAPLYTRYQDLFQLGKILDRAAVAVN